jgi:hypothetical protein
MMAPAMSAPMAGSKGMSDANESVHPFLPGLPAAVTGGPHGNTSLDPLMICLVFVVSL